MNAISLIMAVFSVVGGIDLIIGNKLGLGKEFENGLKMFGTLALSMLGMLVLAPLIAHFLAPALQAGQSRFFEPSVLMASLFANDMGGASLAKEFASTEQMGYYSGLVVGSMMGATVSFTLPFVMQTVKSEQHKPMLLGLMCGICTIPVGCIVAGLMVGLSFVTILCALLPLLVLSAVLTLGLLKFPKASVKIFRVFGKCIQILVIIGLIIGLTEFISGKDIVPYTAPIDEGVDIVFGVSAIMTGAFPLVYVLSKLLDKPLRRLGGKVGINETSALGFLSTLATSVTTFEKMRDMDDRGVLLNSAFAVSSAFTIADHLAFTLSFNGAYVGAVMAGKLASGLCALALAGILFCRKKEKKMWNGKKKAITFSFDDGVTQDIRLVEILNRYGLKATFNINSELLGQSGELNRNGKPVSHNKVKPEDIKTLYAGHEVAVHTLTHPNLTTLDESEIIRQVEEDRKNLSALCGYEVVGMAYPCGGVNNDERVAEIIKNNTGVRYARTITSTHAFHKQENLWRFNPSVYYVEKELEEIVDKFLALETEEASLLYIWGHAYEMDAEYITWENFERICQKLANRADIFYGTNKEVLL